MSPRLVPRRAGRWQHSLPDLDGKARRRCFDAVVESASDADKRASKAVREALELIYGHLTKPERAALRREGIRIS